ASRLLVVNDRLAAPSIHAVLPRYRRTAAGCPAVPRTAFNLHGSRARPQVLSGPMINVHLLAPPAAAMLLVMPLATLAQDARDEWPEGSAMHTLYVHGDCELAGTLTGAGGAWPTVHGFSCEIESIAARLEVVRAATACLRESGPGARQYEQFGCLQPLVAWSMEGN